jgi:hypothetical protein
MSQTDVYEILKELGGEARYKDIKDRAKMKYPNRTLYTYIGDRLRKLERKKIVKRIEKISDDLDKKQLSSKEKYDLLKQKKQTNFYKNTYWKIIDDL